MLSMYIMKTDPKHIVQYDFHSISKQKNIMTLIIIYTYISHTNNTETVQLIIKTMYNLSCDLFESELIMQMPKRV